MTSLHSTRMHPFRPLQFIPPAIFLMAGVALANPVVIRPAKCLANGSCISVTTNHGCVDTQGDGFCDYTIIYFEPK